MWASKIFPLSSSMAGLCACPAVKGTRQSALAQQTSHAGCLNDRTVPTFYPRTSMTSYQFAQTSQQRSAWRTQRLVSSPFVIHESSPRRDRAPSPPYCRALPLCRLLPAQSSLQNNIVFEDRRGRCRARQYQSRRRCIGVCGNAWCGGSTIVFPTAATVLHQRTRAAAGCRRAIR